MVCSENIKFSNLVKFVEWAQSLYSTISITILSTNVSFYGLNASIFCHGTLLGTWQDSSEFSDVRFIDRYDLKKEKQQIYDACFQNTRSIITIHIFVTAKYYTTYVFSL